MAARYAMAAGRFIHHVPGHDLGVLDQLLTAELGVRRERSIAMR